MTQRQHDARVNLRRAVKIFGMEADDTRIAAVQFCYAHGVEPYFRYPIHLMVNPNPEEMLKPVSDDAHSEAEWQRVLRRFVAYDQS